MEVIDGKDLILGRLGAYAAKSLLKGEKVAVVNAEKVVISGRPSNIIEKYWKKRQMQDKSNPEHSQHWPRRPDLFVKRAIRGMLPFDHPKGRNAFRNLKVYLGVPDEFKDAKVMAEDMNKSKLNSKYITVEELCERLGYS